MRRFRVGDRVRFEQDLDSETPRWTFSSDWPGSGKFLEGVVIRIDDNDSTFGVRPDDESMCDWWWPQPDRPGSRYGSPGYLELVEAVEEQEVKSCATCHYLDFDVDASVCGGCNHHDSWAPKPGQTKIMTVDEVAEIIEQLLVMRVLQSTIPKMKAAGVLAWFDESEDILKNEAKERAKAIAEALVGVKVTR